MKEKINKIINFIKTGVWDSDSETTENTHWFIRPFKIILYTIKGIGEHEIMLRSAALSVYTIMSLIPIAALIFGILKGFGFDQNLTTFLYDKFDDYASIIDTIMIFINRMLERTSGGIIAAVGIVVLLWSVMRVFGNIENAFNRIWEVKKSRSYTRKVADYISVIFISPILLVASISLGTIMKEYLFSFLGVKYVANILLGFLSLLLICVLFSFIYWVMPNTKVRFKGASIAGLIAGSGFFFFSLFYFYIQASISSYNAIYGTFAAIPLFLAWLQTSWQIVLIGSELSFAYQNINRYDQELFASKMDANHREKVLLATMAVISKHYLNNKGAVGSENIATELNLPVRLIRDMVFELEKAGFVIIVEDKNADKKKNSYVPAKDVHFVKISEVLDAVYKNEPEPDFSKMPEMKDYSNLIDKMRSNVYNPDLDVYISDLIKEKTN
jgi:membrane protein